MHLAVRCALREPYFMFVVDFFDGCGCGRFLFIARHLVPRLLGYGCDFVSLETFASL